MAPKTKKVVKKHVVKKTVKSSAPKKAVTKRVVKKVAHKKAVTKRVVKKAAPKKVVTKKVVNKAAPKTVVKSTTTVARRKSVSLPRVRIQTGTGWRRGKMSSLKAKKR